MSYENIQYANLILSALELRDSYQTTPFNLLISSNNRQRSKISKLSLNFNKIRKELLTSLDTLTNNKEEIKKLEEIIESKKDSIVSTIRTRELEERVMKLQEELTSSYRSKSTNAEQVIELRETNKKLLTDLEISTKKMNSAIENMKIMENENKKIIESIKEKDMTIQILQDELQALQLELVTKQEKMESIEIENQQLIDRWLVAKTQFANNLNESNEVISSSNNPSDSPVPEETARTRTTRNRRNPTSPASLNSINITKYAKDASQLLDKSELEKASNTHISMEPQVIKKYFIAHDGDINEIRYSNNGTMIASGSNDNTIKIWDSIRGVPKVTLYGSVQAVMSVHFNRNDEFLVGASNDNSIRIWSLEQGRVKVTLTGHQSKIYAARFTHDSSKIVSGSHDRTIKVWETARGYCVKNIFCSSSVNDICITEDKFIVSGHFNGQVKFWDLRSGDVFHEIEKKFNGQITSVSTSSKGNHLLVNSRDSTLKLFDIRTFEVVQTFSHNNYRNGLNWSRASISPGGQYVGAGSTDGNVYIWNVDSGKMIRKLSSHKYTVSSVCWSPISDSSLVSAGKDKSIGIWG